MCGIAGFLAQSRLDASAGHVLRSMTDKIRHRGPDDEGSWIDYEAGVALGHRRLSIIDLSSAGHQPMLSHSGRYVIVYNGEIYNYRDIRFELENNGAAPSWRGHSDTEVLLASVEHWGFEKTLQRLNGMFAFALWDRQQRQLFLARDRLGEKPLYYGNFNGVFLFGSELKSTLAHPSFCKDINRDALSLYLRHNYIPSPYCIWRGLHKLPPAHYLVIKGGDQDIGSPQCYWNFHKIAHENALNPLPSSESLVDDLEGLLKDAVLRRMESDVPLGAFLSGGFDSSTIVALMQKQSSRPIRTFSIGFDEQQYNEAKYAKEVAKHLGTDHTELYVTPGEALSVIPKLPSIWDEPFSDSSQIPTYLVSQMTRRHVTVSLSGDGGDELLCGYGRYIQTVKLWNSISILPYSMRTVIANLLRSPALASSIRNFSWALPSSFQEKPLHDRLPKLAHLVSTIRPEEFYRELISHWKNPSDVVLGSDEPLTVLSHSAAKFSDFRHTMMFLDTLTYLPDDILTKVDRASMAVSLEARVPFLDHRVVEFAWRLPMQMKIKGGMGKYILRQVLYRHVPQSLVDRPKMGFGVPIDSWLQGSLKDWAEELLDEKRLKREGFFDPFPIRKLWEEHKKGLRRWHYYLWDILMFQAWWAENSSG